MPHLTNEKNEIYDLILKIKKKIKQKDGKIESS
jgi:hypothetical protein